MARNEEIQRLIDEETGIDNFGGLDYQVGVMDGVRLADKTMIEKVLNFIYENFYDHPHVNGHICTDNFESLEVLEEKLIKAIAK